MKSLVKKGWLLLLTGFISLSSFGRPVGESWKPETGTPTITKNKEETTIVKTQIILDKTTFLNALISAYSRLRQDKVLLTFTPERIF